MLSSAERYRKILDLVTEQDYISANDLVEQLGVSRETIRRDLNTLAQQGLIEKTHGGAANIERSLHSFDVDTPYDQRSHENKEEKEQLCFSAAQQIRDQDCIFLDNSSTVSFLPQYIPEEYNITFITYSFRLLMSLAALNRPNWKFICLGGDFNPSSYCTGNYLAKDNLAKFHPTAAFISCHGIDRSLQVSDGYAGNIEIKSLLLSQCSNVYLLADSSKMGRNGMITIAPAEEFTHILTTDLADPSFIKRLTDAGCDVQMIDFTE